MANYNTLKNIPLVYPEGNIDLGSPDRKFGNIYLNNNIAIGSTTVSANNIITPKISSIDYPSDDLAANPAGGDTIGILGAGFQNGATVLLDNAYVAIVTVVNDTRIEFTSPTKIAGSYTLYVVNPDGGTAIYVPGVSYSGVPNWTTAAGTLGSQYETSTVNTTVTATGDAPISYTLYSGTLPAGVSLSGNGVLTGTAPTTSGSTTYTFTIRATDTQNQDTDRTFSLTINTDLVTWNSPADEYPSTVYEYSALSNITMNATSAAGKTITYTANSLPTGISISGNIIYGTPTTIANTVSNVTANAASTFRTASRKLKFNVLQDVVTWSSPADQTNYAVNANTAISDVSLSATSAAGKTITYTANTLPNGISLSGNTISGTPTTVANTATLLTATAATTNRSATRTITWTVSLAPVLTDVNWNYVSLLLSANSVVATSSFIDDSSSNNALISIGGDTRSQNFNPYTPGYYSVYLDGVGDYVDSSTATTIGTGDFTAECWVWIPSTQVDAYTCFITSAASSGGDIGIVMRKTMWWIGTGSSGYSVNIDPSLYYVYSQWMHVAMTRSGSTVRAFINGAQAGFSMSNSDNIASTQFRFGCNYTDTTAYGLLTGYISNARIVAGTALYTAAFTPSTSPFTAVSGTQLLTLNSNRFVDTSGNNRTVTKVGDTSIKSFNPFVPNSSYAAYGSGYFDGNGDAVSVATTAIGTNSFTYEAWIYPTVGGVQCGILSSYVQLASPGDHGVLLHLTSTNYIVFGLKIDNTTSLSITSTSTVNLNTWTHVAGTRSGSTCTLWVNGVSQGTGTFSNSMTETTIAVGSLYVTGSQYFTGYISDVRVVNGTAVYTTSFTPPSSPLTAVANTKLLTLRTSGAYNNNQVLDNSSCNNLVTRAGNATPGTFSPYGNNWSNYFDGTGDYISFPSSANYTLGTTGTDFTVECWIFPTAAFSASGAATYIMTSQSDYNSGYTNRWALVGQGNSILWFDATGNYAITSTTLTVLNVWSHIAVVRNGSTITMYVNGISVGSTSSTLAYTTQSGVLIGGIPNGNYFTGYISNARVIKGTARYTSAFTPSTSPLTAVANTQLLTCQSNRLIDNSPNNVVITKNGDVSVQKFNPFPTVTVPTYYSTYFDGTGDFLTVPSSANAAFNLNGTTWTIETWFYATATPAGMASLIQAQQGTNNWVPYIGIFVDNNLKVGLWLNAVQVTATQTYSLNTWNHLAAVRNSGGTVTLYLNGVATSVSQSADIANVNLNFWLGKTDNAPGGGGYLIYFAGYISNLRIVKGTAIYTGAFTPSTSPLTAVANTQLLTCQSNTVIDNSINNFSITVSGDSKPLLISPFTPTASSATAYSPATFGGSIYFDGTGDYLAVANNASHGTLGTSDFTLECWFYHTSLPAANQYIVSHRLAGYVPFLFWTATSTLTYYVSSSNSSWDLVSGQSLGTVLANQWYHLAFTRSGSTFRVFVNGIQAHTFTSSSSFTATTNTLNIGASASDTNAPFFGYITDVRLLKGLSLYNANFYTPATPRTSTETLGNVTATSGVLINGTSGAIVDASRNVYVETVGNARTTTSISPYTGGGVSYYFDGNGDYLVLPDSQSFEPGSGNLTWEMWINTTNSGQYATLYSRTPSAFSTGMWSLMMNMASATAGDVGLYVGDYSTGSPLLQTTGVNVRDGNWHHVALVRNGSSWVLYVDGTSRSTATWSGAISNIAYGPWIGKDQYYGRDYLGYITDLRITNGYARYTTTFTVPTQPILTK